MPNISMNLSANYVTQQRFWTGNLVGKPLSDRRIAFYQRQGRYGPDMKKLTVKKRPKQARNSLAKLMKEFS